MATREAIGFIEEELIELEMILEDEDAEAALDFLKRAVWKKIETARRARLKCHLDAGTTDPVEEFKSEYRDQVVPSRISSSRRLR